MDASENILFLQIFLTPCFPTYPNVLILIYIPTFFLITDDYALCFIVMTRSFISFTISWLCVTTSTVVPRSFASFSRLMISHEFVGSRFPVGSSASRMAGSFTIALAIATRCCSPPESSFWEWLILLCKSYQWIDAWHLLLDYTGRCLSHTQCECNILINITILQKTEILEHNSKSSSVFSNVSVFHTVQILAVDDNCTLSRIQLFHDQFDQCRLTWSTVTNDEYELSAFNLSRKHHSRLRDLWNTPSSHSLIQSYVPPKTYLYSYGSSTLMSPYTSYTLLPLRQSWK